MDIMRIQEEIYGKERRIFSEDIGGQREQTTGRQAQACAFFWYRTMIHCSEDEARLKLGFEVGNFKGGTFVSREMPKILRHQHAP